MIARGQVLVRAVDGTGRYGNADVLDLDDVSFRAWVVNLFLTRLGCVVGLNHPEGEEITLTTTKPFPEEP